MKIKFTLNQRNFIYRKMKYEPRVEEALCFALYDYLMGRKDFEWYDDNIECEEEELFPELYLFREYNDGYWLSGTDRNLVLALMIEMTKSK